ncbi:MAG TPA: HNH endonuclease signature motif containing protein [Dehalococcoidia bacterium]
MLRVDNRAQIVRLPWTFGGLFTGRYAVQSGSRVFAGRWKHGSLDAIRAAQRITPIQMAQDGRRVLWYFLDRFYWDDDGLSADDIKALVLLRERRLQQKVQTARSLMYAEAAGRPVRIAIPAELRRAVFERDGGRCVECGSTFDLQYDHVLPVARGGATTLENLQILCAECNRRKSDTL